MFPKRVSGHCNSAPLSSPVIEDIFYFSRPLMLVIPACLLALDQSSSCGAPFQSHEGEAEKYQRTAEDKNTVEEQENKASGSFLPRHCVLLQHGFRFTTTTL